MKNRMWEISIRSEQLYINFRHSLEYAEEGEYYFWENYNF
jgi:hypothetical protein